MAPGPSAAFTGAPAPTDIMSIVTPPSVNLSTALPSTIGPTGQLGVSGRAGASIGPVASAQQICPPGEAAAEQALLVGSGISCVPYSSAS